MEQENTFLTRSFIKNQQVTDRPQPTNYNIGMMTVKTLNSIDKTLSNLNKNIYQSNKKSFVKKSDPMEKLSKSFIDLKKTLSKNDKIQKTKGILGTLLGIGKFLAVGGLIGYLLFGDKKLLLDSIGKLFSFVKSKGGSLINAIITGDYSGLEKIWNGIKDVGGGLVNFILTGDSTKIMKSYDNFVSKLPPDGLLSQILTGRSKGFNFLKGIFETKGGLFQGLLFGNWDLFWKGIDDLKNNMTWQSAGLLGAILFGKPIADGALSVLSGAITKALVTGVSNAALPIAAAAGAATTGIAIAKGIEYLQTKSEVEKHKKQTIDNSSQLMGNTYGEQIARDNALYIQIMSDQRKKSMDEKLSDIKILQDIENRRNKILNNTNKKSDSDYMTIADSIFGSSTNNNSKSKKDKTLQNIISLYDNDIRAASKKYNVDYNLIAGIIAQESGGNKNAVSIAGAKGLMQLMDSTAKDLGVNDSFNSTENIFGGTKYISQLLKRYNNNTQLALAAYNAGMGNVDKAKGIPNINETKFYVPSVLANAERVRQLSQPNNNIPKTSIPKEDNKDNVTKLSPESIKQIGAVVGDQVARNLPLTQSNFSLVKSPKVR